VLAAVLGIIAGRFGRKYKAALKLLNQLAEALSAISKALADKKLTKAEIQNIIAKIEELIKTIREFK